MWRLVKSHLAVARNLERGSESNLTHDYANLGSTCLDWAGIGGYGRDRDLAESGATVDCYDCVHKHLFICYLAISSLVPFTLASPFYPLFVRGKREGCATLTRELSKNLQSLTLVEFRYC